MVVPKDGISLAARCNPLPASDVLPCAPWVTLTLSLSTLEALDDVVLAMELELREIPRPALFLAARAHAQYRRRGGRRGQVLPDFFIGAHAAVEGWSLLTLDASRFRTDFPTLDVIAP